LFHSSYLLQTSSKNEKRIRRFRITLRIIAHRRGENKGIGSELRKLKSLKKGIRNGKNAGIPAFFSFFSEIGRGGPCGRGRFVMRPHGGDRDFR
jgi:hypothetical protein